MRCTYFVGWPSARSLVCPSTRAQAPEEKRINGIAAALEKPFPGIKSDQDIIPVEMPPKSLSRRHWIQAKIRVTQNGATGDPRAAVFLGEVLAHNAISY